MRTGIQTAFFGLAVLLMCQPALAGPYEDAAAAYMRRSYTEALQLWLPLAEQGNAAAQYNLGAMYENGQGVPRDNAKAEMWYRL
ncbi:MAG: sel1 repeat family protein, partial [Aestuariivirga sp.]